MYNGTFISTILFVVIFVVWPLSAVQILWDSMECSPPGSSVHEFFQARILEWVVIPSSRVPSQVRDHTLISCIGKRILYQTLSLIKSLSFTEHWAKEWFFTKPAAAAKSLQSCPTLCDPTDGSHQAPPSLGFSRQEHWSGLQFPSPMHEKWKVKVKLLSRVRLLATPWTAIYQAPPSMGFSRQSTTAGCHCLLRTRGALNLQYFNSSRLQATTHAARERQAG